jgi:hypothetical protein
MTLFDKVWRAMISAKHKWSVSHVLVVARQVNLESKHPVSVPELIKVAKQVMERYHESKRERTVRIVRDR